MFGFDKLITPKIIVMLYWLSILSVILVFFGSLLFGASGGVYGSGGISVLAISSLVSLVLIRVVFELIMVAFKNNEYLRRIAESLDKNNDL